MSLAHGRRHLGVCPDRRNDATEPEARWYVYLAWGFPPTEAKTWWMYLVDLVLGPQLWLLYIGITYRTGPARWNEHEGRGLGQRLKEPKYWSQYVVQYEVLLQFCYRTEAEALAREAAEIDRRQPLGNTAGKGRPGSPYRGNPPDRKRWRPQRQRAVRYAAGAAAGLWLYLTASLPRLITGTWPDGPEWLAWAALSAAALAGARYWMSARPVGWLTDLPTEEKPRHVRQHPRRPRVHDQRPGTAIPADHPQPVRRRR